MNGFSELGITVLVSFGTSLAIYFIALQILARTSERHNSNWTCSPRTLDQVFLMSVFLYVLAFTGLYILRHLSFHSGTDLGLYDQLVWNTLNGRLLQNSLVSDAPLYLGKSFSPIIAAFVPLYTISPGPNTLIFIQTLAVACAAFPIYWLGRERLGYALGFVIAAAYLMSPAVASILHSDFHGIPLSIPTLALATYFLLHRRYQAFLVCLGIGLLIREEIGFIVIAFGAFIFLFQRQRWFGFVLFCFGIAWTGLQLNYLIPFFHGSGTFYYFGSSVIAEAQTRYSYLGHDLREVLTTIFTRPDIVLQQVLIPDKIKYVLDLLAPLAFLPLMAPEIAMLALPTLGYSLLSTFAFQYSIQSFYSAPLMPFLFFAAIHGAQRLLHRIATSQVRGVIAGKWALGVLILASTASSYYLNSQGPFARRFELADYTLNAHTGIANQVMSTIPADATVLAQTELVPHLSKRRVIYDFPAIPDYRQADYLIADKNRFWYDFHKSSWDYLLGTGYFEIVTQQDGLVVARRRTLEHSAELRYGNELTLVGYTLAPTGILQGGMALRPIVEWRAEKNIHERYQVTVQVVDRAGHVWAWEDREPDDGFSPTDQWQVGKIVGDQFTLPLPPTMPSGDYSVTVGVHKMGEENYLNAYYEGVRLLEDNPQLGIVKVEKNKSSFTVSELNIEQLFFVDMAELRFLGYNLAQRTIRANERFHLGIYWRARSKPTADYIVVIQLRDSSGRVAFQDSALPAGGTYPTTLWDSGEVLLDWHDFDLPDTLTVGDYELFVLLRDQARQQVLGQADLSAITIVR